MSTSTRRNEWLPVFSLLQRMGAFLTVVAIAVFGFWGGHFLLPGHELTAPESQVEETPQQEDAVRLTLPAEKLAAAKLRIEPVHQQPFQAHKAVPGMIVYDATRKIELRATVDCIVKQTLVQSADTVVAGQPLLVLTGPEIGAARSEISQDESNLELLLKEYAWTLDTHTNMKELLALLAHSPTSEEVKSQFENKKLGEHGNEILSAYAELALARNVIERTNKLESEGVIAGKEIDQRKRALDVATAKYNSVLEEMTFQMSQQLAQLQTRVEVERKHLEISREKLRALLGSDSRVDLEDSDQRISEFVVNAPRAGRIVELPAVESARFAQGEKLAEVADTSNVWIEAQISQRDWHLLKLEPDQELTVRVPALPEHKFTAIVKHIGTSVSRSTMAIPLIAELSNADNQFRPGMSIWVDIPISERRREFAEVWNVASPGGIGRCRKPVAAGLDDGAGRQFWLFANGLEHNHGSRNSTSPGDRRDWRADNFDPADRACRARHLSVVRRSGRARSGSRFASQGDKPRGQFESLTF